MTHLKVGGEGQRLRHRDIAPSLEHHHRNWLSRKGIADDKLGYDVQANLVVSDSLNHSDRNDVHEGHDLDYTCQPHVHRKKATLTHQSKDKSPYRHLRRPNFNNDDTEHEHAYYIAVSNCYLCNSRKYHTYRR